MLKLLELNRMTNNKLHLTDLIKWHRHMKQLLLVFIGGGLGSSLRYWIGTYLNSYKSGIPYGTFAANIIGSLIIGMVLGLSLKNNSVSSNTIL